MPVDVLDVTQRFMRDPIRILVKKEELTLEGIRQFYILLDKDVSFFFISSICYACYFLLSYTTSASDSS